MHACLLQQPHSRILFCSAQQYGDVRLVNTQASRPDVKAGIPEIYINGKWGTISMPVMIHFRAERGRSYAGNLVLLMAGCIHQHKDH